MAQFQKSIPADVEWPEEIAFYPATDPNGRDCFVAFSPDELAAEPALATDWAARDAWLKRAKPNPDKPHEWHLNANEGGE